MKEIAQNPLQVSVIKIKEEPPESDSSFGKTN